MRKTMKKLTQGATRLLVLVLGLGLTATGWAAATPEAEWCGTFPVDPFENPDGVQSVTDGTCTISKNNYHNVSTAKGIKILTTESGWPATVQPAPAMAGLTVVVGYRNPTSSSTGTIVNFSSNKAADGYKINANINSGAIELGWGADYDWSADNNKSLGVTQPDDGEVHYVTLAYAGNATQGTTFWFDGASKKNITGLGSSSYGSVAEITLGAIRGPANQLNGVEFVYVAVYSGVLTDENAAAAYSSAKAKVDALVRYEKWSYAGYVLTCNSGFANFENPNYTAFDIPSGKNSTTTYTNTVAPAKWQCFGYSNASGFDSSAYSAPGNVLRFVNTGHACVAKFAPLTIGGMIVESTATGCSFDSSGGGTGRSTLLGDPTAESETWFVFDTSFTNARKGPTAIMGTVNIEVNNGAAVTLTTDNTVQISGASDKAAGANPAHTAGGVLKMHGNGYITAASLDASDATLDFSDLASRYNDTTPFINCPLVVNAATKFVFPAGVAYPYTYKVATSISGTAPTTYTDANGNVYTGVYTIDAANGTVAVDPASATAITVNGALTITSASAAAITVNPGGTLNANANLTGSLVVNGTVNVANGVSIPAINTGSTGKVMAYGSGSAAVSGVKDNAISANLAMVGMNLAVSDTSITELAIPADTALATQTFLAQNGGKLDLSGCTSLTTLKLNLGSSTTFDLGNVILPASCTTVKYVVAAGSLRDLSAYTAPTGLGSLTWASEFVLTETREEYAKGTFSVANVPANATVTVTRPDGSSATATVTDGTARLSDYGEPKVTGDACWHAYEFNNDWTDSVSVGAYECKTWNGNAPNFAEDSDKAGNYFVYTSIRPGPTDAGGRIAYSYPEEWSAAIRCTVPQTANGIIVCFGKVTNAAGQNQYIALVSGDTAGKVKLVHGAGGGAAQTIAEMTVANPTTSQHVYVFTKTATTVTVYCDGDLITSKAVSDSPYQAFQFGTMYGNMQSGSGLSAVTDKATGGMVDYTRLYDFAISDAMIQKLAQDDPYDSSTPTYSREVSGSPWWYTDPATWLKSDDFTLVGVPDVSGIVDLTATADATMTVNLPAAPVYEKLTFQGAGAVTLVKNGSSPKIATAKLVVKTNVTAPYDIADFSGARVSVDAGKVLTFDFSTYPLESVTGVTTQQVTGVTTRADDRYAVVASAKPAWNSKLSLVYDPVEYVYSVVIDPAALVTKNNTTVAYPTVAAALTALSTDAGTVRLLVDYDQDITLSAGQTLDVGSTTYSGTVSVTGTNVEMVHSGTTWKAVDNSVNTWKSSVTAGHWNTASNWENGVVPKTYTRVTFPANDDPEFTGYTVTVKINGNYDVDWMPVCTGMVVNAKVDMVQDASGSNWGTIHLGGNISGTGTLALHKVGLHNGLGSSTPITVSCGLSVAIKDAANQDCYLYGGPFVFEGAVTATSNVLFKAEYCAATFNGTVTMENGTTINGNGDGTTVYNGGISVPADAAATLVGGSRVTIASTVTLAAGATLTIPNAASTSGATFATSVADSYVKATAGESTTVYSVAAKRAATVSVGTNAALSINGNAVADGDTLKFVPGDVLTITASADTYYTPALTVNGVAQTSPYQLTTTDADVTVSVTATLDTYTITIHAGTSLTATWTAATGYQITAGAEQTINPVTSAQTLASPTVKEMSATVSDVTFTYGADYTTAEVRATITGDATSATLTYGGNTYNAQVSNGTATFTDVAVSRDANNIYTPVTYEITTDAHATTGGSGSAVAAETTSWFSHNSSGLSGGAWSNTVDLTEGPATVEDNTFSATTESTSSRVVLEFNVCFSSASDADVEGEAQAAIKLGESGGATTFMVLASNAAWTPVSRGDFVPDASATYKVVMTIDYGNGSYGVTVGDNVLTNASGSASFQLAASKTSVQNIDFAGSGTLTSMKGDQVEGYMVKDEAGHWYATIQAATQAYNSANGPYTVLHDGTAPSGWKIDGNTLIKLAKGFFFMAY